MPAKTPSKGKKAAGPKAPKKAAPAGKAVKKPPVVEDEALAGDEPDDDDLELDDEAPRAAAKPIAPPVKKPAAPASRGKNVIAEDAPAVVPARRLTPEAKARVNEMVKKGMSLGDALKAAAAWETFVAPVKDEPAKLVQGRMGGSGGGAGGGAPAEPRSNFAGETEPEELPEADDEPVVADED